MIELAAKSGEGHLPSSFSVLEVIWTLYNHAMSTEDRFILSKGHAALALYVVLNELGKIPNEALEEFCASGDAALLGHPERTPEWGIEATTGSLGHGLPMACGLAYALQLEGSKGRVFCLVGDQECNEGAVHESMLIAAHHKLDNLICIIDWNESGERILRMDSLGVKFLACDWSFDTVSGHSIPSLDRAFAHPSEGKPHAIQAYTQKGFGVPEMERDPRAWHHKAPSAAEAATMIAQLC